VDTYSTPTLLRLVGSHRLDANKFIIHHFPLSQMLEAYDVFAGLLRPVRSRWF